MSQTITLNNSTGYLIMDYYLEDINIELQEQLYIQLQTILVFWNIRVFCHGENLH